MKKVLIVLLALVFVLPVGMGLFGGSSGPAPIPGGGDASQQAALREKIESGIRSHCYGQTEIQAELDRCVDQQTADLQVVIQLLQANAGKPALAKMESCMAEHVPTLDAPGNWSKARACIKERAGL